MFEPVSYVCEISIGRLVLGLPPYSHTHSGTRIRAHPPTKMLDFFIASTVEWSGCWKHVAITTGVTDHYSLVPMHYSPTVTHEFHMSPGRPYLSVCCPPQGPMRTEQLLDGCAQQRSNSVRCSGEQEAVLKATAVRSPLRRR